MGQRDSLTYSDRGTIGKMYPPASPIVNGPDQIYEDGTYEWRAGSASGEFEGTWYHWYRQWIESSDWELLDGGAFGVIELQVNTSEGSFNLRVIAEHYYGYSPQAGSVSVMGGGDEMFVYVEGGVCC